MIDLAVTKHQNTNLIIQKSNSTGRLVVIVSLCARMVTSFGCAHHISRASKRENVLASCAGLSGHSVTESKTGVRKPLYQPV